jgi:hypothetical protein
VDGFVAGFGACDHGGVLSALHVGEGGCFRELGSAARLDGDFGRDVVVLAQTAMMGSDGLLDMLGQVVP